MTAHRAAVIGSPAADDRTDRRRKSGSPKRRQVPPPPQPSPPPRTGRSRRENRRASRCTGAESRLNRRHRENHRIQSPRQKRNAACCRTRISAAIGAVAAAAVLVGLWLAGFTLARDVVTSQTEGPQAVVPIAANCRNRSAARQDRACTRDAEAGDPGCSAGTRQPARGRGNASKNARRFGRSAQSPRRRHRRSRGASRAEAVDERRVRRRRRCQERGTNAASAGGSRGADKRIAALESAVKTLSEQVAHPAASADQAVRLAVAAQALQVAVERGVPYQAELKAVQSLGAAPKRDSAA